MIITPHNFRITINLSSITNYITMVLQCLNHKYPTNNNTPPETPCEGSFEKCAKPRYCNTNTTGGEHCFLVWQPDLADPVLSAGCNPLYTNKDEKCGKKCIGQVRGPRYYCCCTEDLCNQNYELPLPQPEISIPPVVPVPQSNSTSVFWYVIPLVLLVITVGVFIFKRRRRGGSKTGNNQQNRRIKAIGDRELNELRNNQDVSILIPFRKNIFNSTTNNNNNINSNKPSTNNHDADHYIIKQQDGNKIDLSSIELFEIIGSGRFGRVHRASVKDSEEQIAVKIISSSEQQSWLNEQQIYNSPKIKHPNILKFLYSQEHSETESYWLIVEYASKGSLYSFLKDNIVDWKELVHITLGIVRGLSHLHEADIAHRDFKSKNVLLKHDLTPCITDFGVASILDSTTGPQLDHRKKYLQVGTPRYMAPEVLECSVTFTKSSFTKIDVYALSLVLWELISRCRPLSQKSTTQYFANYPTDPTIPLANPDPGAEVDSGNDAAVPPYMLPFEDVAGPHPDINEMRQIVVVEKLRPTLRDEWRAYPASEFCRAIEDGWEYDHDARISASCFVERIESLPQIVHH